MVISMGYSTGVGFCLSPFLGHCLAFDFLLMHQCNPLFFRNAAMNTDHAYGRIGFRLTSPREYCVLRKTCPALMV